MKFQKGKIYYEIRFDRFADEYRPYFFKLIKRFPKEKSFLAESIVGARTLVSTEDAKKWKSARTRKWSVIKKRLEKVV